MDGWGVFGKRIQAWVVVAFCEVVKSSEYGNLLGNLNAVVSVGKRESTGKFERGDESSSWIWRERH